MVEDWAVTNDLRLMNQGTIPTCVRTQGCSMIDLTWATSNLASSIAEWEVKEDLETGSDHQYILFKYVSNNQQRGTRNKRKEVRWNLKGINQEYFDMVMDWKCAVGPVEGELVTPNGPGGECLDRTIKEVCEETVPKITNNRFKKQVYWWSARIAELRSCIKKKREWTRVWKNGGGEVNELRRENYREARKVLRNEIRKAKNTAWAELVQDVDRDPWGLAYKVVLKKLKGLATPLSETIEVGYLENILDNLLPAGRELTPIVREDFVWEEVLAVTPTEVLEAIKRERPKSAPGPDGINIGIWKKATKDMIGKVAKCFIACLKLGSFPEGWKKARMILIPKGEVKAGVTLKVRPICLLNDVGKIFETILVKRLNEWLVESARTNLSERQFGFRKGHSTIDAIRLVKNLIEGDTNRGKVVLAIAIDIENTFNSIPWGGIRKGLAGKKCPPYLKRIVENYLSNRWIECTDCKEEIRRRKITAGIPQGSVLGPLL